MNNSNSTNNSGPGANSSSAASQTGGFSPWQRLKTKQISYLTLPLLFMATVTEFVILATGWRYQQTVCLPQGMGVTFFGIGPIGATILAVELLKLPLAIWTASRAGWQKGFMLVVGLPCICVLTFQLVKDMAVYEMGTAMAPAAQFLEKATAEEVKISHLNGELQAIEGKRTDREHKLTDLAAKQAKAKAELEDSLKRNETARQDAISLTDYQKKELSEVETRQANIIQQFNADTEQLTKSIADLRARREAEFARAGKDSADWEKRKAAYDAAFAKWHTEDARIDNAYKTAMADYANKKSAYEKDKAEYLAANFLHRQLMKEPLDPGVPPVREANKLPKPDELTGRPSALIAEIDTQLKAKEAELLSVNNKRRDRIAQVDADARRLREEFDHRSVTKREESDKKREELTAALAALVQQEKTEHDAIDQEFAAVVQKVDSIRADIDASRKKAESYYELRESSIRKTQVHRIATTVEIVRGLIKGERPMSIKATPKERGDILTDQISMVRIWVYPVLAFIVAFLPTLMVEIGFSTVFKPDQQRPPYRVGFFGRGLHWLYIRAGRQKIARAERLAKEATAQITSRDKAVAEANAIADKASIEKETELQAAQEALQAANEEHARQLETFQEQQTEQARRKEEEWVAKLAGMADSLNRSIVEKDSLRDLQKSEIERQIQMRQNAWSERLTQLRQELDEQRDAAETERTALMQEHHKKLMEVSEDCKTQILQARRQVADAELAAVEKNARLSHEVKEAAHAREVAEAQVKRQADEFSLKLAQVQESAAREMEKMSLEEKHRIDLQRRDLQTQSEQELRRRELEWKRQMEAQARDSDARLKQELQQQELAFRAKLAQREQELSLKSEGRESELQNQLVSELRGRQEEWERQAESRLRATETRLGLEAQQKEALLVAKARQRDQQWQSKLESVRAELQAQHEEALRRHDAEAEAAQRELETRFRKEWHQAEEATQARVRQREQELVAQATAQAEARLQSFQAQWESEAEKKARAAIEPYAAILQRTEKERDEARQVAADSTRQAQSLEKKLTEASSFLSGWRNGKRPANDTSTIAKPDWVLE